MKRFNRRRVLRVVTAAVIAFTSVGVAHAFFSGTGSGSGSGSTGSLTPVTVTALAGGDAPSSSLLPGGPAADVILRLSNPNSFAVTLVSVTLNGSITPSGGKGTCSPTGVSFTNQTGLSISVPSGSSLVHLPGAATMSTSSSDGCQGATFAIQVAITVHK